MRLRIISFSFIFVGLALTAFAEAQTLVTFSKKGEAQTYNISLQDARIAYQAISQVTLNPPSTDQFVQDYIRYHIMLKEAYDDKSLIQNKNIQNMITHPALKRSFEESLYRTYAMTQMQGQVNQIRQSVQQMSSQSLRNYYVKNPNVRLQFILLEIPFVANPSELANLSKRVNDVYNKVKASKKPFVQLISLYSDNRSIGFTNNSYAREQIHPFIYEALLKLNPKQISKPIRVPGAYYIVQLQERVPFEKTRITDVREQIYNIRSEEVFNNYSKQLLSQYQINLNRNLLKKL